MGEDTTDFENSGCPWEWQIVVNDETTKQAKNIEICGIEALPRFLTDFGSSHLQVAQSIQSMRNEDAKNVHALLSAVTAKMKNDELIVNKILEHSTRPIEIGVEKQIGEHMED